MGSIRLERYTALVLRTGDHPPELSDDERLSLQDAHLSHFADLHEEGHIIATGPLIETDPTYRGLVIFRTDQATAAALMADDPMVKAGEFRIETHAWLVPADLIVAGPGRIPRSVAEVAGF